jgi:hypothetical protein
MSELISGVSKFKAAKLCLLTSVSALSLMALFSAHAVAEDRDRPTIWIELGGQLERLTSGQESYSPPFISALLANPFTPPAIPQAPPRYSNGEEGRISFNPEGSDWVFSVAMRYGRANGSGNLHEETSPASAIGHISVPALELYSTGPIAPVAKRYATTAAQTHQTDLVLDFQAGKDIGVGVLGPHGVSIFGVGIRFAQFTSRSKVRIDSDPNFAFNYKYISTLAGYPADISFPQQSWNLYSGKMSVARSFHGLGPSLSWDASTTVLGNEETSSLTFDWGLNGALLFGRQKAEAHHTTMAHHVPNAFSITQGAPPTIYPTAVHNTSRSRSVVVPNLGGFAGLSLRFPNAKISLGYRIDAFFGAMDGGIDARQTHNRDFYGPFATISIGLGG